MRITNMLTIKECQEFSMIGCEDCAFCKNNDLCKYERAKNKVLKE